MLAIRAYYFVLRRELPPDDDPPLEDYGSGLTGPADTTDEDGRDGWV
jgi:hypothetical protein